MLPILIRIAAVVAAALVGFGFAIDLHPAAQTTALLRPMFGVFCLLGLWFGTKSWEKGLAAIAVLATVLTVVPTIIGNQGQDASNTLRLYSKNLLFQNTKLEDVVTDIVAAQVDVVMLQEVSVHNDTVLAMLAADFPHQHLCRFSGWSGVAVLARAPLSAPRCSPFRAAAAAQTQVAGRAVWVVAAHIPWPWPYETEETFAGARDMIAQMADPVVIAGDFNALPWTGRVRDMAQAARGRLAGPNLPTLRYRGVPLMIDLAIAPGGGVIERRPLLGSDHRGIVATVNLDP